MDPELAKSIRDMVLTLGKGDGFLYKACGIPERMMDKETVQHLTMRVPVGAAWTCESIKRMYEGAKHGTKTILVRAAAPPPPALLKKLLIHSECFPVLHQI